MTIRIVFPLSLRFHHFSVHIVHIGRVNKIPALAWSGCASIFLDGQKGEAYVHAASRPRSPSAGLMFWTSLEP
jgi:hypothetical protein